MSNTKHLSLAFVAGLAIAATLGTSAFSQAPAPSPGANPISVNEQGGQLQQITVTGYIIPRVGEGPQPVVSYDQDYVQKQAYQTVTDVLRGIPLNNAALSTYTNAGINSSPASAAVN